jgi:hypothetical protein
MCTKFNETMLKHGFAKPNIKGFMANNAQPIGMLLELFMVVGIDKKHTYLFHWIQSFDRHTKKNQTSYKINIMFYATNTRMQNPLWRLMIFML